MKTNIQKLKIENKILKEKLNRIADYLLSNHKRIAKKIVMGEHKK